MQQVSARVTESRNHQERTTLSDRSETGLETGPAEVNAPPLRASLRISIPYGFDAPLPIINGGSEVVASGHGGCTADQQVTIAVTVTQTTSGAEAAGETIQDCTGLEQNWSAVTSATTISSFVEGTAEACGFATTRDNGSITDTFEWCVDVDLVEADMSTYLPIVMKP